MHLYLLSEQLYIENEGLKYQINNIEASDAAATKILFYYSLILLSLVLYSVIILCIQLIESYHRWSFWGIALGTLFLGSMPV